MCAADLFAEEELMITILPKSHDNIIGIEAEGKVTDHDYKDIIIPAIDDMLRRHDRGNFLYYLGPDFTGFELSALWDDMQYAAGHHERFDKIALVGGPAWVNWTSRMFGHFVDSHVRVFDAKELDKAWDWVNE